MPDTNENKLSATYQLAMLDREFLLGDATRGARLMLEYQKTEQILQTEGIVSTLVCFGSARAREGEKNTLGRAYDAARVFARLASERGGALNGRKGAHHNVIATGGGPGIMEAANRGAREAGAPSIGFNITLPHEQEPNRWSSPHLTFQFHYFAVRKFHLAMRAAGLVVFPGGFGTLDELFEIITLQQTGKMHPCPIVLYDRAFWQSLVNFDRLVEEGLIGTMDLGLVRFAETPEEIWQALLDGGVKPYPRA